MEEHPEQTSDGARLQLRKRIHANYSRIGYDVHDLARTLLDLRPTDDVLDIGCGLGEFLMTLRKEGHLGRLQGIDRSGQLIDAARREAARSGCHIDWRVGEAQALDSPSACFDCVTALNVLGDTDTGRVLAEMGRVLKAEGRVVVSTNSRTSYPILGELKRRAHDRFGWFLANEWAEGFDSESAPETLRRYFGKVQEFRYDDVLQYPDAEVLVDFFRSTRGLWNERLTGAEWERIVDWARDQAIELIPEHGYAEDPRIFSLFRCAAPLGL
jgi:ubiquinone/menaquinone biosynthesis C-methylase UbiE